MTIRAEATCSSAAECPDGSRSFKQNDDHKLAVVPVTVSAGTNLIPLRLVGGTHEREHFESHDGTSGGCEGSDAESDGSFALAAGLRVVFDFYKGSVDRTAVTLGESHVNDNLVYTTVSAVPDDGPTATRILRRMCNGFSEEFQSQVNFDVAARPFSRIYAQNESTQLVSKTPTTVSAQRCEAGRCTRTISGSSSWRTEHEMPGFSGTPVGHVTTTWSLTVDPAVTEDEGKDDQSSTRRTRRPKYLHDVDAYCSGGAAGEFATDSLDFADDLDLIRLTSGAKQVAGPIGVGFGVLGAACTARDLWDAPVDDAESAVLVGACTGLSTFSLGVGAGSLLAAGTFVGLPAAAVGGGISFVTGLGAQAACAFADSSPQARAAGGGESYQTIPTRRAVTVRFVPSRAIPRAVAARLSELARNTGRLMGAGRAFGRCLFRAEAAASAGDTVWHQRQRACGADNAVLVATGFRKQSAIHRRIGRAIRASGMRTPVTSTRRARRVLANLPVAVTSWLRRVGASRTDIGQLQRVASRRARNLPVPRTLRAALTGTRGRRAFHNAARAFDKLARELRAPATG